MEDDVDAGGRALDGREVADVALDHLAASGRALEERQVRAEAAREVVEDAHRAAVGDEALDEVRPDEAGAAGDERVRPAGHAPLRWVVTCLATPGQYTVCSPSITTESRSVEACTVTPGMITLWEMRIG